LRGLAKKPEERFARVGDFVRALSGAAVQTAPAPTAAPAAQATKPPRSEPISDRLPPAQPALSVSTALRTGAPWWRRRRTFLIAAGLVVLLLALAALNNRERPGGGGNLTATDDHGNTMATATVITAGTHSGALMPAGDVDMFRLNVPANTNIVVELRFGTLPRGNVAILSSTGQVLDDANDSAPRLARATYNAKDAGAYYIRVSSDRTDATGTYTILLTTR
jgi:hypothetical protein